MVLHQKRIIWLVKMGEPIPTDPGVPRMMRTSYLARALANKQAEVTWWTCAFDHHRKVFRELDSTDKTVTISKNFKIQLLESIGYFKNISLRRWLDDIILGYSIYKRMNSLPTKPHTIVCSYPLMFVAFAVTLYGEKNKIPVILDVRDMWPDIFSISDSRLKSFLGNIFAFMHFPLKSIIFSRATALIGITEKFLLWSLKNANRDKKAQDRIYPLTSNPVDLYPKELEVSLHYWANLGVTKDTYNFCYFGVFSDKVDLITVIESAKLLNEHQKLRIVFCGNGDNNQKILNAAFEVRSIVLPGWVDAAKIKALMSISIGGLVPLRNRKDFLSSLPNKAIEYISAGLPLISGIHGDLEQLINNYNCGLSYREGDKFGLAANLYSLFTNRELQKSLSKNALNLYKKNYDANIVYDDFATYVLNMASKI